MSVACRCRQTDMSVQRTNQLTRRHEHRVGAAQRQSHTKTGLNRSDARRRMSVGRTPCVAMIGCPSRLDRPEVPKSAVFHRISDSQARVEKPTARSGGPAAVSVDSHRQCSPVRVRCTRLHGGRAHGCRRLAEVTDSHAASHLHASEIGLARDFLSRMDELFHLSHSGTSLRWFFRTGVDGSPSLS
jgi:hypothetical protein